jgi:hypothetical protein
MPDDPSDDEHRRESRRDEKALDRPGEDESGELTSDQRLEIGRGRYIGPVSSQEALEAIRAHPGIVRIDYSSLGAGGGENKSVVAGAVDELTLGWDPFDEESESEPTGVFVFSPSGQPVSFVRALLYENATVLDLSTDGWSAERYTGGLDISVEGRGALQLVFLDEIGQLAETADDAPGFGPAEIELEQEETGELE